MKFWEPGGIVDATRDLRRVEVDRLDRCSYWSCLPLTPHPTAVLSPRAARSSLNPTIASFSDSRERARPALHTARATRRSVGRRPQPA